MFSSLRYTCLDKCTFLTCIIMELFCTSIFILLVLQIYNSRHVKYKFSAMTVNIETQSVIVHQSDIKSQYALNIT